MIPHISTLAASGFCPISSVSVGAPSRPQPPVTDALVSTSALGGWSFAAAPPPGVGAAAAGGKSFSGSGGVSWAWC
jgi:hypothetical protein